MRALTALLETGRAEGTFPSAAAWVATELEPRAVAFAGEAGPETLWDVASLTKPVAVGTLAMQGVAEGWLDLDERVREPAGLDATVADLLAHRSGLPAWDDLRAWVAETTPGWRPGSSEVRAAVGRRIGALAEGAPVSGTVYSDLGYVALGWHLERRMGRTLRETVAGFRGPEPPADPALLRRFAPTGRCPRRRRRLRGEVNDLNAWVLGGAAGHAGIFATVDEVGRWALDLARAAAGQPASLPGAVVRDFWSRDRRAEGATWVLGWDTPSPGASSAGCTAPPDAVGHLGFTGTSVWIEPSGGRVTILLTNRVDRGEGSQGAIKAFRPRFHDAVRALDFRDP